MPRQGPAAAGDPGDGAGRSAVGDLLDEVIAAAAEVGREDLSQRLAEARGRFTRTDTIVCVVGEFKQGKSALINALLSKDVCPVDDDLATMAVTVVRWGEPPSAFVRRRVDGELTVDAIDPGELPDWVTERGNRENRLAVELADVVLPDPFLEHGITLVDTPGVGGLNAAHAAATLAFLPIADALVFVTDASAELTAAELEFLAGARAAGPPVLVALTKTDMYPQWRRILEIDSVRLREAGLDAPFPLSATLRARGRRLRDLASEAESGFGAFEAALVGDVTERARAASAGGAVREARVVIDQLRQPCAAELEALDRPESAERLAGDLRAVRARLARLEDASAHWSARLDDEFEALRLASTFAFHDVMRRILRAAHEEIEQIDPGRVWPEFSQRVQRDVAAAVHAAFVQTTDGAGRIQGIVAEMLADEGGDPDRPQEPVAFDAAGLWTGGQTFGGVVQATTGAGRGLVGGAKVGVEMLGLLGALLGTALVGPAMFGAVLLFGGKGVVSERRRQLTDRRQEARSFVTAFVDDVQFEMDGRLASLGRELQRQMRARFAERIGELTRTSEETAAALARAADQVEAEAGRRRSQLRDQLAHLAGLRARAEALGAAR